VLNGLVEADVMAKDRQSNHEVERPLDLDAPDPLSETVRLAELSQAALGQLRAIVEDTAQRVAELSRANAVFEWVADRLVAATLKATENATRGEGTYAASLALVEELAELARRSLAASGNGRCQLREYQKTAVSAKTAAHETHAALDALLVLVKQLEESSSASTVIPTIEVETRPPPLPKDVISQSWGAAPSNPGRYKN
jgi:hypothetical protein